ncbi:hypothetical protein MANAM107_19370 [Actinomyces capricornis]|uniref:Uncharacterized protein n=1 Tax=Actinomyces capricornis TaxID=2755559 RepID=A0ABN6K9R4_9ACTO|nr:hypothetical protein MANAM107_19370 [Actinomyces capricornis]
MTPGQAPPAPPAPPDAPTAPLATHPIGAEAMRRAKRLPAMVDGITPRARRVARLRLTFREDVDVTITYRTAEIDRHDNLEMNIALTGRDWSAGCFSDCGCYVGQAAFWCPRSWRSTSLGVRYPRAECRRV